MFTISEPPTFTFGFVWCIPFMFVFHFSYVGGRLVGWSSSVIVVHRCPSCSVVFRHDPRGRPSSFGGRCRPSSSPVVVLRFHRHQLGPVIHFLGSYCIRRPNRVNHVSNSGVASVLSNKLKYAQRVDLEFQFCVLGKQMVWPFMD